MLQEPDSTPRIVIKSSQDIVGIARAGALVRRVLQAMVAGAGPGVSTASLDALATRLIEQAGAEALFRGYVQGSSPPFPAATCISVNEEVVHGIPGERRLRPGDVVSFDVGIRLDGWCGDSATTIIVGDSGQNGLDEQWQVKRRLIDATRSLLVEAIGLVRPGVLWSTISRQLEARAMERSFGIVMEYVGHGIGRELHEPPKAPAYFTGFTGADFELRPGMVLAIEPMLTIGLTPGWQPPGVSGRPAPAAAVGTQMLADGWTIVTVDGSIACHEEHIVAVTSNSCAVLTG